VLPNVWRSDSDGKGTHNLSRWNATCAVQLEDMAPGNTLSWMYRKRRSYTLLTKHEFCRSHDSLCLSGRLVHGWERSTHSDVHPLRVMCRLRGFRSTRIRTDPVGSLPEPNLGHLESTCYTEIYSCAYSDPELQRMQLMNASHARLAVDGLPNRSTKHSSSSSAASPSGRRLCRTGTCPRCTVSHQYCLYLHSTW
jgi:hypothetical protein